MGHKLDFVYLVQIFFAVAGCYALFRAGRKIASVKVGLSAAGLAAVYGVFIFYDVQILKESVAVTLVCFLLWVVRIVVFKETLESVQVRFLSCGITN